MACIESRSASHLWVSAYGLVWIFGLALLLIAGGTTSPELATAEMDKLVARAELAEAIHPVTAQEIERLIRVPSYDCRQVKCTPEIAVRNSSARARLQNVLAGKTDRDSTAIAARRIHRDATAVSR